MDPVYDLQLEHPQMQALIKDKTQKFDLILVEANTPAGIVLRARFKAPVLLVSTMTVTSDIFHLVGADTNHLFYPDFLIAPVWDLSFGQKLCSFYNLVRIKFTDLKLDNYGIKFLKRHLGQEAPSMEELEKDVEMLFLNAYRYWDNNRPAPIGSVLYMGGFHLKPPNSLPEHIKTFVDESKHGVVVMSFGSKFKLSTLPKRILRIIINVYSTLPYDFIWKWDTDKWPDKPHNIKIVKKLPQNELLHHPKVRALVTHGGLLSTHEAIAARVPLVGLPLFSNHWQNAWQYEKLGIGICLDIDHLNENKLRNAVVAVVEEKK
ncbi:UDP-glucosyltransferase 2-like [Cydia splendana]|uniref:UDP-glucosyltransferase 2-like n=1 Tax=Cydia splendana TaxID=1100963 RepID=UPI00300D4848